METPLVTNTTNTSLENAPHLDPGADLEQIPGAIISNGDLIDHILHYSDEKLAEDIATQPDKMWTWVATNMNRGHIAEYRVGMLMYHRQVLLAIPGRGQFVIELRKFSEEYGVSVATLYRRIKQYEQVRAGLREILLVRIPKEAWDIFEPIERFDRLIGSEEADEHAKQITVYLAEAEKQVAEANKKSNGPVTSKTIRLEHLTDVQILAVTNAMKALVTKLGSKGFSCKIAAFLIDEASGEVPHA